jgi:hypothetical protein
MKTDSATFKVFLFIGCLSLFTSCKPNEPERLKENRSASPTPAYEQEIERTEQVGHACMDMIPADDPRESAYDIVIEPFDLVVPSGNRIYGLITRPDPEIYPDYCFPAVVAIPGGINAGRMQAYGAEARVLAQAGMVVVNFNAEGRGGNLPDDIASEGTEDYNGFRHQESLCALVRYVMTFDDVINDNVGLRTQSFGITMGIGCAARHPELSIKYIVDGEGPPNSYVTVHEPYALDDDPGNDKHEQVVDILGHYSTDRDSSPENLAFWEEREAIRFIGQYRGRYIRLQATWDHAQPPSNPGEFAAFDLPPQWWRNKHTMDMVNEAVTGGVPWVCVNLSQHGNPVNATYGYEDPPVYLEGKLSDRLWGVLAVLEMARMQ